MTEAEARAWLEARCSPLQLRQLEQFVALLAAEAQAQSLIARSTFDEIWARHIVDSAQLIAFVQDANDWLDVGSGGGLPGIVVAILRDAPITLVDLRRKRTDFLRQVKERLRLQNATVVHGNVRSLASDFGTISARAVAPIETIFGWTQRVVSRETTFVLQRGKNWQEEVARAQRAWHGAFHVEQSITSPDSAIVIAKAVRLR